MKLSRRKTIFKNVAPAILSNACVFLFSVADGIFVGNGCGIQALGAVNIPLPFVLIAQALNAMASIGGVTITAIRFGRGDKEGAQNAFMHSLTINGCVGILITLFGCVFTSPVCGLPEAIAQFSTPVTTLCMNYTLMATFGDIGINVFSIISYLSSFTMSVFFGASEGMQPLFGQAYGAREDADLKYYYRAGQMISVVEVRSAWQSILVFHVYFVAFSVRISKTLILLRFIYGNIAGALLWAASIPLCQHIFIPRNVQVRPLH